MKLSEDKYHERLSSPKYTTKKTRRSTYIYKFPFRENKSNFVLFVFFFLLELSNTVIDRFLGYNILSKVKKNTADHITKYASTF